MNIDFIIGAVVLIFWAITLWIARADGKKTARLTLKNKLLEQENKNVREQQQFLESTIQRQHLENENHKKKVSAARESGDWNSVFKDAPSLDDIHFDSTGMEKTTVDPNE